MGCILYIDVIERRHFFVSGPSMVLSDLSWSRRAVKVYDVLASGKYIKEIYLWHMYIGIDKNAFGSL